jgi:hypothetical protein
LYAVNYNKAGVWQENSLVASHRSLGSSRCVAPFSRSTNNGLLFPVVSNLKVNCFLHGNFEYLHLCNTYKPSMKPQLLFLFMLLLNGPCNTGNSNPITTTTRPQPVIQALPLNKNCKVVHVYVALCDNKYQGIVPVPKAIGNGQDPSSNLYWGAAAGVKTYLKKQPHWQLVTNSTTQLPKGVLERCVFKHKKENLYLVADAYDGRAIKQCTIEFLESCSGKRSDSVLINNKPVYCGGSAQLLAYTGHDGLMDFSLPVQNSTADTIQRSAIVLACISKKYFAPHIKVSGAKPLLWTTGLCSPEAYTLDAALQQWMMNKKDAEVQQAAAAAYHKYQHCGIKAAGRLMVTGW